MAWGKPPNDPPVPLPPPPLLLLPLPPPLPPPPAPLPLPPLLLLPPPPPPAPPPVAVVAAAKELEVLPWLLPEKVPEWEPMTVIFLRKTQEGGGGHYIRGNTKGGVILTMVQGGSNQHINTH